MRSASWPGPRPNSCGTASSMMLRQVSLTVLVDDRAGTGLVSEHGWSLWIETGDRRILFDTGQGAALLANAQRLGIALDKTDILVLSHGHYDHTGGVSGVLTQARKIEVYCHPAAFQPRYRLRGGTPRPIGMPPETLIALDRLPIQRLHWVSRPVKFSPGLGLTGPIPRKTNYEDSGGPFYLDLGGKRADPFEDDQALWIDTPGGLIVCVGCCHAGLVNTLNYVCRLSGTSRVRALIGGFHLVQASAQRLQRTAAALLGYSPGLVAPCHCTGKRAIQALRKALGDRVAPGRAGRIYRL